MTRIGSYISPVAPEAKAAWLQANAAHGWGLQPGASSIEEGFILRAEHPTGPVIRPPAVPLRPTRPSGWRPFWTVLASPVVAALAAWAVTR